MFMNDILNSPSKALLDDLATAIPDAKITKLDWPGAPRYEIQIDDLLRRAYLKFIGKHRAGQNSDMVDNMMQDARGKNELLAIAREISREET